MLTGPATAPSSTGVTIGPHTTALNNCTPLCDEPRASCIHRIRRNEICRPLTRKAWPVCKVTAYCSGTTCPLSTIEPPYHWPRHWAELLNASASVASFPRRLFSHCLREMTRDVTWPYRNNIYTLLHVRRQRPFRTNTSTDQRGHAQPRGAHAPALGRRGAAPSAAEAAWGSGLRAEGTHVLANLPDLHPQPNPRRAGQFDRF